ncbi:hypothetical protein CR194_04405 [Salipaludibacillus keqinensis]|uniref:Uncharacterized protein n=1 Tax=Salipaludibacillus keqinensis TaxID=2045207 RepID=A0A323TKY2_9BACI|nr:hypothetical protein [Salipaludibacillus keqinensis]PYZ94776.1 hypothetical protein CR194_04405 [Salipaludibacillus keqinensis]
MSQVNVGEWMAAVPSASGIKNYEQIIIHTWQKNQLRQTAESFIQKTDYYSRESIKAFLEGRWE